MSAPSTQSVVTNIVAAIEAGLIDMSWIDEQHTTFAIVFDDSSVWMRSIDADEIIKITVERLPKDEWPGSEILGDVSG